MRSLDLDQTTNSSAAPAAGWVGSWLVNFAGPVPQMYVLSGAVLLLIIMLQVRPLTLGHIGAWNWFCIPLFTPP